MAIKRFSIFVCILAVGLFVLAFGGGRIPASTSYSFPGPLNGARAAAEVPSYHPAAPPAKRLPPTLDPMQFPDPINQNAYAMASKVKAVLYQQPCYCHCDKAFGHGSLLDCYTSTHAAECNICKMEAIYAFNENAKKKSAAQIREGIIKGESEKVDLAKYREYKPQSSRH